MTSTVTPQFLLEGAVYALEQCGLFLRDANLLYRGGSYASAVALAAFGREELGRWTILLDLRRKILGGEDFTIEQIQDACADHVRKQGAGMKSITMRANRTTGLGKILTTRIRAPHGSAEQEAAREQIDKLDQLKKRREPDERHKLRMSALYVDVTSDGRWNRPKEEMSAMRAYEFISDATNDYSIQQDRWYTNLELVKADDPELHDALQKWSDRPQLPAPEWPLWPQLVATRKVLRDVLDKIPAVAQALRRFLSQSSQSYANRLRSFWPKGHRSDQHARR
jgi:AbiV family abortive infection protein